MHVTALALVGWLVLATTVLAFPITRCGQNVGRSEVGELTADLDCPGSPGTCNADATLPCTADSDCPDTAAGTGCNTHGPRIDRGTLRLNGHTLSNHDANPLERWAVGVVLRGGIEGPGAITAPDGKAVAFTGKRLTISDVEIRDSRVGIDATFGGKVRATNLVVHDLQGAALDNSRGLKATNVTVTRCGLDGSLFPPEPSFQAIYRSALIATRTTVTGLVATDNGGAAVLAASVRINGGTLAGNAGGFGDWDILTARRPRLVGATCYRSGVVVNDDGPLSIVANPWPVCAAD